LMHVESVSEIRRSMHVAEFAPAGRWLAEQRNQSRFVWA
jgi:hypothetical protein